MEKTDITPPDSLSLRDYFRPRIVLQALLTSIGVSYQLEMNPMIEYWGLTGLKAIGWNLTESFEPFSFAHFMLIPGLCLIYAAIDRAWTRNGDKTGAPLSRGAGRRLGLSVHLPALLFGLMMVLGWSFARYNTWNPVLTLRHGQLIKSFLVFAGYALLFRYLIQFAYLRFALNISVPDDLCRRKPKIWLRYENCLREKPFRTAALTLLILYLPMMIISYPGRIVSDTVGQTLTAYPELSPWVGTAEAALTGKPGAYLSNHHPVAHTMLLHLCLVAGHSVLHSWNAGFFLYSVLQELAFIFVFAFLIREHAVKYGISGRYAVIFLVHAFANPLIHNYIILNSKDVPYALFLLLTIYFWHQLLTEGGRRNLALLLMSATGVILFRNEGQYVLLLASAGTLLLNRKTRKQFAAVLLYVAVFSAFYFHVLFPALGIIPGSRREILSIPFQQTARYIHDFGEEVTPEEREAIGAVLDYEQIPEKYNPNISDPVKDLYLEETATSAALARYLRCWARMGLKHPGTYLAAFVNNKYAYFYPNQELLSYESYKRTSFLFSWITELAEAKGIAPAQPAFLDGLRDFADDTQTWLCESSPLSVLMMSSLYPSLVLLMLCYSLRRRDRVMTSVCLIPFLVLLVCLAGPTNGTYSRYTFPLALVLPAYIPILRPGMKKRRETESV